MISRATWRFAGLAVLWSAAMTASLQIRHLDGGHSAFLCGPWGCAPAMEALAAYHGGWLVMLAPVVVWLVRTRSPTALRCVAYACLLIGLLGLAALGAWQALVWYPAATEIARQYPGRCYLIALVSLVDVPIMQMIALGPFLRLAASRKQRREVVELASRIDESGIAPAERVASAS